MQLQKASAAHGRIADIEVLRAFAVGMVLVAHAPFNLIPWVWPDHVALFRWFDFTTGVDLFFAISGFVIARSLLPILPPASEPRAFFNTALSFWVRRAWRLLPSAWLWLVIPCVASVFFNRTNAFGAPEANFKAALAAFLNVANFHLVYAFGHYASSVFHYWTLSLEEQFYLVLPFLVFFARRRLPLALAVIVIAQVFMQRTGVGANPWLTATRSDALSLGVLLAIWTGSSSYRRFEPVKLKPLAPLLLIAFLAASGPLFVPDQIRTGVLAVLAATIVWLASYGGDYIFPPGPLKRVLCWVGGRSYGLYLIHVPVYFGVHEFWFRVAPGLFQPSPLHAAVMIATAAPLVLGLAELNYRFFEEPLRRRGAQIAERIHRRALIEPAPAVHLAA